LVQGWPGLRSLIPGSQVGSWEKRPQLFSISPLELGELRVEF